MKKNETLATAFDTYTILGQIGGGANGEVYSATNRNGEVVAIKIVSKNVSIEKLKRFKNEFLFGQNHHHKNILQTIEYGLGESAFFVMPKYDSSLRKLMKSSEQLDVYSIFDQVLHGVEAAHLYGVIHRDIKPENILVRENGLEVVVADFGIARFNEQELYTNVNTKQSTRLANFEYAAPEQRRAGQVVDERADIYALGLILNEMFTEIIPAGSNYRKIGDVRSEFSYLDPVVEKAIGQSPESRYRNIEEFKMDIGARRGEFIASQKLDVARKIVIPDTEILDPIPVGGTKITNKDWNGGELRLRLNHVPGNVWQNAFNNFGGHESVWGKGPETFHFEGMEACIYATANEAVRVRDYFAGWLPRVDTRCREILKQSAEQEQRKKRTEYEAKVKAEQTRLEVLKELNQ
ncbi:MAG: serine/threonine protein kinase [Phycisphaerales bacterium]|nr:serine/threonine protein kinase [Phycisphaerales bacterium]